MPVTAFSLTIDAGSKVNTKAFVSLCLISPEAAVGGPMTNNDVEHEKLQVLIQRAQEERRKRRNFIAWLTLPLLAAFVFGLIATLTFNAKFNAHPLIGGIAPQEKGDSVLYTIVDFDFPKRGQTLRQYREWVINLPKDLYVYGVEDEGDTRISMNGLNLTFKHKHNQLVSWHAKFDSLEAVFIDPHAVRGRREGEVTIWLYGDTDRNIWNDFKKRLEENCIATGTVVGPLQEYKGRTGIKYPSRCNDMGYVLWSDSTRLTARAAIECSFGSDDPNILKHCKYEFNYGRKKVWGDYPISHLADAAGFFDRLEKHLKAITVADQPLGDVAYVETPAQLP